MNWSYFDSLPLVIISFFDSWAYTLRRDHNYNKTYKKKFTIKHKTGLISTLFLLKQNTNGAATVVQVLRGLFDVLLQLLVVAAIF